MPYHLNTQEESEQRDYQRFGKAFSGNIEDYEKRFGTRSVLHCKVSDKDDPTEDPVSGASASKRLRTPVRSPRSA
ncbi:hypothetical protein [Ensifer sp. SSB1]|uniref:hypothetical protein n=1 Tax=Ensifer sp. SSB1 TaxID=2795385 RepID=UPI001A3E24D0|nr:hypothetical protein [Ensifer sp. SSB1]MBK5568628.1 hypothetical protein [Ensifer sp. SSB1]